MKTAIVTGAASGIGLAIAQKFAWEGYWVFGMSRRENGPVLRILHTFPGLLAAGAVHSPAE